MRSGLGQGGLGIEVREELEGGGEGQSHAQTRAALHSAGTPQPAGEARGDEARPLACGLGVIEAEGSNVLRVPVFRTPRDREGVTKSTRQRVVGGTSTTTRGRRRRALCCMRVAALHAPVVLGCALTEEDQGCRNGQMRNSKETVGYMADI